MENTKMRMSSPNKPSSVMLARNMLAPSADHAPPFVRVAASNVITRTRPKDGQIDYQHSKEDHGRANRLGVAGQRPGVREFHRAVGDSDARFGAGVALRRTAANDNDYDQSREKRG